LGYIASQGRHDEPNKIKFGVGPLSYYTFSHDRRRMGAGALNIKNRQICGLSAFFSLRKTKIGGKERAHVRCHLECEISPLSV